MSSIPWFYFSSKIVCTIRQKQTVRECGDKTLCATIAKQRRKVAVKSGERLCLRMTFVCSWISFGCIYVIHKKVIILALLLRCIKLLFRRFFFSSSFSAFTVSFPCSPKTISLLLLFFVSFSIFCHYSVEWVYSSAYVRHSDDAKYRAKLTFLHIFIVHLWKYCVSFCLEMCDLLRTHVDLRKGLQYRILMLPLAMYFAEKFTLRTYRSLCMNYTMWNCPSYKQM